MCFVCLLAKQHTTFKWKHIFSMFSVLQGSAETLIRWGGKIYHLPIACFLVNIFAKSYQNPTTPARVTAKNVGGVFWDTVYIQWKNRGHFHMHFKHLHGPLKCSRKVYTHVSVMQTAFHYDTVVCYSPIVSFHIITPTIYAHQPITRLRLETVFTYHTCVQ